MVSRIMPVAGGGFEQCYNAQSAVATESLLVVSADVSQAPNDKQQLTPMLDKLSDLPANMGRPDALLADAGYFSEANVEACAKAGIDPLIAPGRQPSAVFSNRLRLPEPQASFAHHPAVDDRFTPAPPAPEDPTSLDTMLHRLKTLSGRALMPNVSTRPSRSWHHQVSPGLPSVLVARSCRRTR